MYELNFVIRKVVQRKRLNFGDSPQLPWQVSFSAIQTIPCNIPHCHAQLSLNPALNSTIVESLLKSLYLQYTCMCAIHAVLTLIMICIMYSETCTLGTNKIWSLYIGGLYIYASGTGKCTPTDL